MLLVAGTRDGTSAGMLAAAPMNWLADRSEREPREKQTEVLRLCSTELGLVRAGEIVLRLCFVTN